eukprot:787403-Prymnesium_polylepis.1
MTDATGHVSFWRDLAARHDSLQAFKDCVVKDQELIALVGALIMTVAFAYDTSECDVDGWWGTVYVVAATCCILLSTLTTAVAVRTVSLINAQPSDCTVSLLESLEEQRRCLSWAHSFNLMK